MVSLADSGRLQRRATWADSQAAIGAVLVANFGEWEDDEHSAARLVCPVCGLAESLQLWPENDGKIGRQCLEGCPLGAIDSALQDTYGLRVKPLKPVKPRGEPAQGPPLESLHPSSEGDGRRMIQAHGPRLLIVIEDKSQYEAVYVLDTDTGIWESSPSVFLTLHCGTAKTLAYLSADMHTAGRISAAIHAETSRWAKRTHSAIGGEACRKTIRAAYNGLVNEGRTPAIGGVVTLLELDRDGRYLGTASGVVDLNTGELLTPDAGARHLVTRSTGIDYDPAATDPAIDALLSHLDPVDRDYLLDAAAYTLRGNPAGRWYVLSGPPRSGKSTFLRAVGAALGNASTGGYAFGLAEGALLRDRNASPNGHTDHLKHFPIGRFAYASELPTNGARFNDGMVKRLTGGDDIEIRAAHQSAGASRSARATIFQAVNPKDLDRLSLLDTALALRTSILEWPSPPWFGKPDVDRVEAVTRPAAAAAMLALLIDRARELKAPPAPPASVASAVEDRRRESLGALGQWLSDRVKITGDRGDYVQPDSLWAAAYAELDCKDEKIGTFDRRGMVGLLREVLPGLPAQKHQRIDGTRHYVYSGVKLLSADEVEDGEKSCPGCGSTEPHGETNPPVARVCLEQMRAEEESLAEQIEGFIEKMTQAYFARDYEGFMVAVGDFFEQIPATVETPLLTVAHRRVNVMLEHAKQQQEFDLSKRG